MLHTFAAMGEIPGQTQSYIYHSD